MTLIAVNFSNSAFYAMADSRASRTLDDGRVTKITDRYTKLYRIPYKVTKVANSETVDVVDGAIGFSFAGNIFQANALVSMTTSLLHNLHDASKDAPPPTFELIARAIQRAAEILNEDTIITNPAPYKAFLFGFCPSTKKPCIYILETVKNPQNHIEIQLTEETASEGCLFLAGSGAAFWDSVKPTDATRRESFESRFLHAVRENPDPGTGGPVQLMSANGVDLVEHTGIIEASDDLEEYKVFVAAVEQDEFGIIDGYGIVRRAHGIDVTEFRMNKMMQRYGFDPALGFNSNQVKNFCSLVMATEEAAALKTPIDLRGLKWEVEVVQPETGSYYFSKVCSNCFRLTPLLPDRTSGAVQPMFKGLGEIVACCIHCNHSNSLNSASAKSCKWIK